MGIKEILDFVKIEHMLFSLPFVLIGFVLADKEFGSEIMDLIWIKYKNRKKERRDVTPYRISGSRFTALQIHQYTCGYPAER